MPARLTPAEMKAIEAKAAQRGGALIASRKARNLPRRPSPTSPALQLQRSFGAGWPPDTVGDVGPNHYIQMVNTSIGIFNKTTGTRLVGITLNNFFTGPAGTPCDTSNDGDVVVLV